MASIYHLNWCPTLVDHYTVWNQLIGTYIGRVIMLVLVTGQRPGEVTGMRWSEMDGSWWTIPKERARKNERENRVYLTYLARLLLPSRVAGEDFVFPAQGRGRGMGASGGMRPGTASRFISVDNNYFLLTRWTPHDLRRTMATELARLGCPDEVIDEVLNHKKKGIIGVYNKYRYDVEKRFWLRKWSRRLIVLIKEDRSSQG
jgi:integrase